ncbi:hypothetical protein [Donghicola tyrosinivorans]|uniref:hypothetical protein n=1 Tax=Donghicola tyrosinivorans TaxID=1652492 RepID=UPI0011B1E1C3|nr:hypothetical protein [Donghicola tyrosinivorans]
MGIKMFLRLTRYTRVKWGTGRYALALKDVMHTSERPTQSDRKNATLIMKSRLKLFSIFDFKSLCKTSDKYAQMFQKCDLKEAHSLRSTLCEGSHPYKSTSKMNT